MTGSFRRSSTPGCRPRGRLIAPGAGPGQPAESRRSTIGHLRRRPLAALAAGFVLCAGAAAAAAETYQAPTAFLEQAFAGAPPPAARLWVGGDLKAAARSVLDHDFGQLRVRYWARNGRNAWILEEIGKERPITTGVVIDHGALESVKVLIYRESRGYEVRYPFFTDQFRGARLDQALALDRSIDGISGATMSVAALTKIARLALLFDRHLRLTHSNAAATAESGH